MNQVLDFKTVQPLTNVIPVVSSNWTKSDFLNTVKVRWGIGRNNYRVTPGLYKLGNPDSLSDVFVTANYKLSFDVLRKNLESLDAWILVLNTKGVNVWCAAGKGNFGTENLVNGINNSFLKDLVKHNRLIVPQLAATGVAAFKVKEQTGFRVIFGPVRANDIKDFVNANYNATPEMRKINFPVKERTKLIPVDLMHWKYKILLAFFVVFILSGLDSKGLLYNKMISTGVFPVLNIFVAFLAGTIVMPILMPVVPFRAFSLKGAFLGFICLLLLNLNFTAVPVLERIALGLLGISIASFIAMNFTGSSTFTSLSGVKLEMKWSIPFQAGSVIIGFLMFTISKLN